LGDILLRNVLGDIIRKFWEISKGSFGRYPKEVLGDIRKFWEIS
jgi:hypothetical protein